MLEDTITLPHVASVAAVEPISHNQVAQNYRQLQSCKLLAAGPIAIQNWLGCRCWLLCPARTPVRNPPGIALHAPLFSRLAELGMQGLHGSIDRGSIAEYKTRHESIEGVVDFAILGDLEHRTTGLQTNLVDPQSAIRKIGIGD